MILTLHGLADKYSHVRDPILGSPIILNFTSTCSTLLRMSSQRDDRNCSHKPEKWHHRYYHYGKFYHKTDGCYALQSHPPHLLLLLKLILTHNYLLWILILNFYQIRGSLSNPEQYRRLVGNLNYLTLVVLQFPLQSVW